MQLWAKWALQSRRVCLSTLESDALLTCRVPATFSMRAAMNLVSHCQGAAGVGCCAGTGEPEQGWQQNMRAVPYPTLCSPVVKREQNRSSDSDKSPACKPIAMRQEGQGRK